MKPALPKDISALFHQAFISGRAIAFFRLPGQKNINYISGPVSRTINDKSPAFAFAAFDSAELPYYINDSNEDSKKDRSFLLPHSKIKSTSKKHYYALVNEIVKAIKKDKFKKIVAARVLAIGKPDSFDVALFFEKICGEYNNAFISLTYIPGAGLWLGASPEILVSETKKMLTIYSLAGTKKSDDYTDWNDKELHEQDIVTGFIRNRLTKVISDKLQEKGPATITAGGLKHLLTVFSASNTGDGQWKPIVKALHPTPAVAGLPKKRAVGFIKKHEGFDRGFYAGYLGPVNYKGSTDLFVNLRCMEVTDKQLLFYAGCGITQDSDHQAEWIESKRKIDVLKSLL